MVSRLLSRRRSRHLPHSPQAVAVADRAAGHGEAAAAERRSRRRTPTARVAFGQGQVPQGDIGAGAGNVQQTTGVAGAQRHLAAIIVARRRRWCTSWLRASSPPITAASCLRAPRRSRSCPGPRWRWPGHRLAQAELAVVGYHVGRGRHGERRHRYPLPSVCALARGCRPWRMGRKVDMIWPS